MKMNKTVALVLALTLVIGVAVGGTLAWLTANTTPVMNTFTPSNIGVSLTETDTDPTTEVKDYNYKMIPGWTINKDPKVAVTDGSEDCWLFVKITESTSPDLDAYIAYQVAAGWTEVSETDNEVVIGRKVYQDDETKSFSILGTGKYDDGMDPNKDNDTITVEWGDDQVCVKPSVTEDMMEAIANNQPTLTFQAYAVQLYKVNSDGNKADTDDEFDIQTAWTMAQTQTSGN